MTKPLDLMRKWLHEDGSRAWKWYGNGLQGQAWCCAEVCMAFNESGNGRYFYDGKKVAYCPAAINWCKANLAQIPLEIAAAGDIVFFDWQPNGLPDHIGLIESRGTHKKVNSIEGNTGTPRQVRERDDRTAKQVQGIFRPLLPVSKPKELELTVDGKFGTKTIYSTQKALDVKATGILTKATVKAIQKLVGTAQDGAWGNNTSRRMQKYLGVEVDADFGSKSVKAWQRMINEKNGFIDKTAATGKAVDVSYWQGKEINWTKVKADGYTAAILRASYTAQNSFTLASDSTYKVNYKNATAAGVELLGVYHYSQATSKDEALREARYVCEAVRGDKIKYIAFDWEFGKRLSAKVAASLGVTRCTQIIEAFCQEVIRQGYTPLIYCNLTTFNKYVNYKELKSKYKIWLAQYPSNYTAKSKPAIDCDMWQYSSTGKVAGISGNVDVNVILSEV